MILGVRIDAINQNELDDHVRSFFASPKAHKIFTPNAEMLLLAHRNLSFKECLNQGDLNICDGVSLTFAERFLHPLTTKVIQRVTGVDTLERICALASETRKRVLLVGGSVGVAEKASEMVHTRYPHLHIKGLNPGTVNATSIDQRLIDSINTFAPDVLAVALGHGKQEQFICSILKELPSVKVAIGVGGALDYLSGNVRRAPIWMRKLGLEWLYRLMRQPKRIGRIFNAVIIFPLAVIWDRIKAL